MEAVINSVNDELCLPLPYQLSKTAGYIIRRRDVSLFASGSDLYTPDGGTLVIRVNSTCENWLVPRSLRMMFTLNKKSRGTIKLIGNLWSLFQRMRVMCGGQVIEYITGYNRVHEMIRRLQPSDEQSDNIIEGFGNEFYASANEIKARPGI